MNKMLDYNEIGKGAGERKRERGGEGEREKKGDRRGRESKREKE